MKYSNRIVITVLSLSLMICSLGSCGNSDVEGQVAPELIEPAQVVVNTAKVIRQDMSDWEVYQAIIEPDLREVSFLSEGTFDHFEVAIGEFVQKGQVFYSNFN